MELRQFISATILDYIGGVKDAQGKSEPGTVVPLVTDTLENFKAGATCFQVIG
jgi:hypothetical protein